MTTQANLLLLNGLINEWPTVGSIKRLESNSRQPYCMLMPKGHEFNPQVMRDSEARFQGLVITTVLSLIPSGCFSSCSSSEKLFLAQRSGSAELVNHENSNKSCNEMLESIHWLDFAKKKKKKHIYNLCEYWHIFVCLGSLSISNEDIDV